MDKRAMNKTNSGQGRSITIRLSVPQKYLTRSMLILVESRPYVGRAA